jgi:hypothetical protein
VRAPGGHTLRPPRGGLFVGCDQVGRMQEFLKPDAIGEFPAHLLINCFGAAWSEQVKNLSRALSDSRVEGDIDEKPFAKIFA